ncbi:hypothetical protein ACQYWQ_05170 [Streptomyces sp. P6-2-1]|uniref:hypothetical protein n=1 Tax=unclassified Streptomyces TaxID=2593676 RepID=UPI003D36EFAC
MTPRTLRRKSLWTLSALGCCGLLALAVVIWVTAADQGDSRGDTLMVCSVLLALCWALIRIGRCRVEIREGGLVLVDWWRREWVPWGAYMRVDTSDGFVVVSRGEREHTLVGFGSSLVEESLERRGRGLLGRMKREIREASATASPEALRDREVLVRRWEFIPADLLLAQVLVCLALTQTGIVPM